METTTTAATSAGVAAAAAAATGVDATTYSTNHHHPQHHPHPHPIAVINGSQASNGYDITAQNGPLTINGEGIPNGVIMDASALAGATYVPQGITHYHRHGIMAQGPPPPWAGTTRGPAWGVPTKGKKTRNNPRTDQYIVRRRKKK